MVIAMVNVRISNMYEHTCNKSQLIVDFKKFIKPEMLGLHAITPMNGASVYYTQWDVHSYVCFSL